MSFSDNKKRMYLMDYTFTPKVQEVDNFKDQKSVETKPKSKVQNEVDDSLTESPSDRPVWNVRLFNGKFEPLKGGFGFNKDCRVSIEADLPKGCNHARFIFRLFCIYKDKIENMSYQKEGFIKKGKAEAILTLFLPRRLLLG